MVAVEFLFEDEDLILLHTTAMCQIATEQILFADGNPSPSYYMFQRMASRMEEYMSESQLEDSFKNVQKLTRAICDEHNVDALMYIDGLRGMCHKLNR